VARPIKEGIDYFPFDVDLIKDRKLRRVKIKYGPTAVMVYISLLCILYKDKGYYIDYFGENKEDVLWEVCENLQGKYQPDVETVESVIEDLVACGLFDEDHFISRTIITSRRAQRTYYGATVDRKTANINYDYWLLSENEMKELSSRHPILINFINRPKNEVNRPDNSINQPDNTQSKVEKSRVEKSKEKNIGVASSGNYFDNCEVNALFLEFLELRKTLKCKNTEHAIKLLVNKLNDYPDDVKKLSLEDAIMNSWKSVYPENTKYADKNTKKTVAGGSFMSLLGEMEEE
jgi:hypothetical protein